ncbi:MAG TPA: ATP-binding cassette domain-containing protein [Flavipsychrobacter sp.]|nr:ATP-binding cassette domain-containing protein [Flavipsychrobacter sp.]
MEIILQQLAPTPLKDKITENSSDVWKKTLSFHKGEHVFIQAPSGTGKTTLIHILYGLRTDYEGEVHWDGKLLNGMNETQQAHLRAGFLSVVFQDLRLFSEFTTWENLEIKRTLTNTVAQQRVEEMLQRLGILEKKNALAKTLSYGEQQRVAIIRALLQPFDWLLMDEPFSHLDSVNIDKAVSLIAEVSAANNAGIILADLERNDYFLYHKKLFL